MTEKEIANVSAQWSFSLDCECPFCKKDVDLCDEADFFDSYNNIQVAETRECEQVSCPKCGGEFNCAFEY